MLSIAKGYSADYLLGAIATGRENYYTGAVAAGEPPGRWYGAGAEELGLRGLVDAQDMTALYERFLDPRDPAFRDPARWDEAPVLGHTGRRYATEDEVYQRLVDAEPYADAERRTELRVEAGRRVQGNVAFLDATFSVQKSVTILHTAFEAQEVNARTAGDDRTAEAWAAHRTAVEDAIWAGNRAALDYLADRAGYARTGHHGGPSGRYIDAHDWTIASFFQHDSRDHDPQLHIHNAILNRGQGADGKWRTLDGRSLYAYRGAAAAVAERVTEEHLTQSLGVRFATRPDGKAREIIGIPDEVTALFSARRRAITAKTRELVTAFEAKFDRSPNSLELDRLQRQATFATRRAKTHDGESIEQRLDRWDRELRAEVAGGLAQVATDVLAIAGQGPQPKRWSRTEVIETALADVQSRKAAWTASDLTRAISNALPDHLGNLDAADVTELLDGLTDEALSLAVPLDADRPGADSLPAELRLADGRSAYEAPGARLYATPEHVHTERLLLAHCAGGSAPAISSATANQLLAAIAESGPELGADQAAAVRGVLTSGAGVEAIVGPAGTGKSRTVGVLAHAWTNPDLWNGQPLRAFGLATSQIATDVLAGEGLTTRNIARWLDTQRRLEAGAAARDGDDAGWRLASGDLVVVDESAMTDTGHLAAIQQIAAASGAKLLLVGDHRQLAAVGQAGGMELAATTAPTYELTEARRFTETWEAEASLRLRERNPSALHDYHKHGRLLDADTIERAEQSAIRAWLADTLAGQHALLIVDTNEQAARVSAQIRAELVRLGHVTEAGVPLGLHGTWAGIGDLVQARRNAWHLAGVDGNPRGPINRETYRVVDTTADGGLIVAPIVARNAEGEHLGARMTLPAAYVREHVALGYASTVHAAQGLTVDTSHTIATPSTSPDAFYVGISRGRDSSTAHVVTRAVPEDAPAGVVNEVPHRNPIAVLTETLDTTDEARSALQTATESADDATTVRTPAELLADAAELATAGRTARWLDELSSAGHLTQEQRLALAAEDGAASLNRLLRRAEFAGHDPRQVLEQAITSRPLDGARQITNVLHHRISDQVPLDPRGDTYAEWVPAVDDPAWQHYLTELARAADARRDQLGHDLATQPSQWAIEALGPVPDAPNDRAVWERQAGTVAAHRELTGHDDPAVALPDPPRPGQVEAYASWRAAWRALGRPDADRDELEMSDGQLRLRVRAYEREAAWAPRYVAHELAGTAQAADRHRETAALRSAEAAATTDLDLRARLEVEAAEAAALADVLRARHAELQAADDARAQWLAHTAGTRAAADRARAELAARHAGDGHTDDRVTAEEWLAAHRAEQQEADLHQEVTDETDLAEVTAQRDADLAAVETHPDTAETAATDIRELIASDEPPADEDTVRVPTADETAATIERAQRALAEIAQRRTLDRAAEAEAARADQLNRWHADDRVPEASTSQRGRTLEVASPLD